MGYQNPSQDRTNREARCLGRFHPRKYTVRVDDMHKQWCYEIAAQSLLGMQLPGFFVFCVEYVTRYHPGLKEVRRVIRLEERELRKRKRQQHRAERKAKREALKLWKG